MTLDQSLANLQAQTDRLAGLFAGIADNIEAGHGTMRAVKEEAGPLSRTELVYDPNGGHFDHRHEGYHGEGSAVPLDVRQDTPPGVVATTDGSLLNFEGENYVPQTPQGASPSSASPVALPTAGAVEVEGPGASTPEAPRPADPRLANPFDSAAAGAAPAPAEKKKGRRTHEELAADAGVDLADVKRWLGEGKKVTKAAIEEFAALPRTVAPAAAADPAPQAPAQPQYAPQHAAPLPTAAADPFGQGPAQEWPAEGQTLDQAANPAPQQMAAPAPAPVPPTPSNPFGQPEGNPWEGQPQQPITDWSPFSD